MKKVYYNDFDKASCVWLRELIADGLIPDGDVDDRSILEVKGDDVRGYTQAHFFAGIGGWVHALNLAGWPEDRKVWTGSCPCFPSGTLIFTKSGLKPIENISVGDIVLTHKKRFRKVTEIFKSQSRTLILKGQGHFGLKCTGNHPFWSRAKKKTRTLELEDPKWVDASDMLGKRWECASIIPKMAIPKFTKKDWKGKEPNLPIVGVDFFRFLGYWVGDGWIQDETVVLCSKHGDSRFLLETASKCGLSGSPSKERTAKRLRIGSKILVRWITENFGRGARNKTIPTWIFGLDRNLKEAFIEGYLQADGHQSRQLKSKTLVLNLTTVSKNLAIGTRMLLNSLGYAVSIAMKLPKRDHVIIENRRVNEKGFFRLSWQASTKSRSFKFDNGAWGLVRSVKTNEEIVPVFNFEVEEDHSYVADGIVVHNCQPFSCAGKGLGVKDERHLWPVFGKLIKECHPSTVFGEQVSSAAGRLWLSRVRADLEGMGYAVGACDLSAAGIGAPHIRQRLFWIGRSERAADSEHDGRSDKQGRGKKGRAVDGRSGEALRVADASGGGLGTHGGASGVRGHAEQREQAGGMADSERPERRSDDERGRVYGGRQEDTGGPISCREDGPRRFTTWDEFVWHECRDKRKRRIPAKPKVQPVAHGLPEGVGGGGVQGDGEVATEKEADIELFPVIWGSTAGRVGLLKGAGNAIVPQIAAEFLMAYMSIGSEDLVRAERDIERSAEPPSMFD